MKALLLCDDGQWERIGALARHRFEIGFRAGQQLRAQHLVLHLGYVPKTSPITRRVARCVDFWQDLLAARSPEMTIHLETRRGDAADERGVRGAGQVRTAGALGH